MNERGLVDLVASTDEWKARNEGSASAIMMRRDIGGMNRGVERRQLKMGTSTKDSVNIYRHRFQLRRQPQHLSRT